ncbi:MAG: hypothetical protein WDA13_00915 [Candidatus Shapirobacteria bacterium]
MKKENKENSCFSKKTTSKKYNCHNNGSSGAIYGLGVIGALFYFLSHATSFGMVLIGIGKSIFWPAILMFKLLTYLGM